MKQPPTTNRKTKTRDRGSLLLELLIAFGIISLSLAVVVESFIVSQRSFRTTTAESDMVRAITFFMEDISREARVSTDFGCADSPPTALPCSGANMAMTRAEGVNGQTADLVQYALVDGRISKTIAGGDPLLMTPNSVTITRFDVTLESNPVRAFIVLTAEAAAGESNTLSLQTTLFERPYL